jgi:hypothetical protein
MNEIEVEHCEAAGDAPWIARARIRRPHEQRQWRERCARTFVLGALRFDIARSAKRLRDALESFDEGRNSLIKELSGVARSLAKITPSAPS